MTDLKLAAQKALEAMKLASSCIAYSTEYKIGNPSFERCESVTNKAVTDLTAALQHQEEREPDAVRLDWLERQSTDGVHVECCHSGSFSGADLQRVCTVFMPNGEHKAGNLRAAIDAARASTEAPK